MDRTRRGSESNRCALWRLHWCLLLVPLAVYGGPNQADVALSASRRSTQMVIVIATPPLRRDARTSTTGDCARAGVAVGVGAGMRRRLAVVHCHRRCAAVHDQQQQRRMRRAPPPWQPRATFVVTAADTFDSIGIIVKTRSATCYRVDQRPRGARRLSQTRRDGRAAQRQRRWDLQQRHRRGGDRQQWDRRPRWRAGRVHRYRPGRGVSR